MNNVTYRELVVRYGAGMANELLIVVEKFSKATSDVTPFDREERLRSALIALNDNGLTD